MTNKTTMPEPVAYAVTNKRHQAFSIALHHDASFAEGDNDLLIEDLITTEQAEAYAQAKMQELIDAAKALADWAEHEVGAWPELTPGLQAIRALIPKEPPCET